MFNFGGLLLFRLHPSHLSFLSGHLNCDWGFIELKLSIEIQGLDFVKKIENYGIKFIDNFMKISTKSLQSFLYHSLNIFKFCSLYPLQVCMNNVLVKFNLRAVYDRISFLRCQIYSVFTMLSRLTASQMRVSHSINIPGQFSIAAIARFPFYRVKTPTYSISCYCNTKIHECWTVGAQL